MPTVTVTATGAGSFTIPTGVLSITVESWGPGGGGAAAATNNKAGGSGGSYRAATYSVVPGDIIYWSVGAGNPVGGISNETWHNKNSNSRTNGWINGLSLNTVGTQGSSVGFTAGGGGGAQQGGGGSRGGGGGGGAGSATFTGGNGAAGSGSSGGAGGNANNILGPSSGNGINLTEAGTGAAGGAGAGGAGGIGGAPGGGGGGGGSSSGVSGIGGRGQIRYSYEVTAPISGTLNSTLAPATLVGTGTKVNTFGATLEPGTGETFLTNMGNNTYEFAKQGTDGVYNASIFSPAAMAANFDLWITEPIFGTFSNHIGVNIGSIDVDVGEIDYAYTFQDSQYTSIHENAANVFLQGSQFVEGKTYLIRRRNGTIFYRTGSNGEGYEFRAIGAADGPAFLGAVLGDNTFRAYVRFENTMPAIPVGNQNLISNGTFGNGNTAPWLPIGYNGGVGGALSIVNGRLRVTGTSGQYGDAGYVAVPTVVGRKYHFYFKATPGNGGAGAHSYLRIGTGPNTGVFVNDGASSYSLDAPRVFTFTAQSTTTYIAVGLNGSAAGDYTDFDDFELYDADPTPISAVVNVTLSPASTSSAGVLTIKAAAANTLGAATTSSSAKLDIKGTSTRTLAPATSTSAGALPIVGTFAGTSAPLLNNTSFNDGSSNWYSNETLAAWSFSGGQASEVSQGSPSLEQTSLQTINIGDTIRVTVQHNGGTSGYLYAFVAGENTTEHRIPSGGGPATTVFDFPVRAVSSQRVGIVIGNTPAGWVIDSIEAVKVATLAPATTTSAGSVLIRGTGATGFGPNKLANGTFDSDTDWNHNPGRAEIANGKLYLKSGIVDFYTSQNYNPVAGETVQIKFDVEDYTDTFALYILGGAAFVQGITGNGTYIYEWLVPENAAYLMSWYGAASATIDNVSIRAKVITLQPTTLTAAGGVPPKEATVNITLAPASTSSAGVLPIVATATKTLTAATTTSAAKLDIKAVSNNTLVAATTQSLGALPITGQSAPNLLPATSNAGGSLSIAGQAANTLAPATGSSAAALNIRAQVGSTLAAATSNSSGVLPIVGAGSANLAPATSASAAKLSIVGQSTNTLAPAITTSSGQLYVAAVVNTLIAASTSSAAGKLDIRAQTSGNLAAALLVSAATVYDPLITPAERKVALTMLSREVAIAASGPRLVVLNALLSRETALIASLSRTSTIAGSLSRVTTLTAALSRQVNLE